MPVNPDATSIIVVVVEGIESICHLCVSYSAHVYRSTAVISMNHGDGRCPSPTAPVRIASSRASDHNCKKAIFSGFGIFKDLLQILLGFTYTPLAEQTYMHVYCPDRDIIVPILI